MTPKITKTDTNPKNARALMADAKFFESYSRFNNETQKYETWDQAVERVMDMHRLFYKNKMTPELTEMIDFSEKAYKNKELLGAQRALQFGGEQLLKNNSKLYNCTATYVDRVDFFKESLFLMLSGCGIGFSVQKQHIKDLPDITERTKQAKTFVVPDSIEGWADAVGALMSSFFVSGGNEDYRSRKIYFDLSEIRPKGSEISGGFKAPGPEPLRIALDKIELRIKQALKDGKTRLSTLDAYDCTMFMADAVISGGVRRAASICLFSKDDNEMITAKTGNWFIDNPQRGRSNNSVVLLRGETTQEEFHEIMKSVKEFGEPGFVWTDDLEILFNPCVAGDTLVTVKDHGTTEEGELASIGVEYQIPVSMLVQLHKDGEMLPMAKSYNKKKRVFEWGQISNAWLTHENHETIEIELTSGETLTCTPDHKIWTENRGYVEAGSLTEDDEIVIDVSGDVSKEQDEV